MRKSGASNSERRVAKQKGKHMNKLKSMVAAVAMVTVLGAGALLVGCKHNESEGHSGHVHQYTCAMHPEVKQSTAGNCPKCGMKLTHKE